MRQRTTPWHMATLILPEPHLILSGKYRSTSCTYRVPLPFYECKGLDAGWKSLSKISRFYRGVLKIILKIAKQIQYLPKLFRNSENKYTTTEKLFYNSESKYTTHQITWPHYCNKQQIAVNTIWCELRTDDSRKFLQTRNTVPPGWVSFFRWNISVICPIIVLKVLKLTVTVFMTELT